MRSPQSGALAALAALVLAVPSGAAQQSGRLTPELVQELGFREIGPAITGGRIHDVEALPDDPATVYVATASGGLWKTVNKGTTWTPLFDDQPVSTFGDVAIAASDPDVIWAGTGEQNNRQSTSWGNGVYRSTDGGESWTHLGLAETRHIGEVQVHPRDADIAWVAALGNLWRPSEERGVYKTMDGGRTWDRVLFVDTLTGVVDLVMDPSDPDVLYAAAYQRLRRTWGFNGGGPGSGIYKTTDGGASWIELTADEATGTAGNGNEGSAAFNARGLPTGDIGRIGLAIARTNPRVLNATIQHDDEGGTYRTEDGGESWERVSGMNPRPMYYSHIYIDPTNEDRVYILGTDFYKSEDGGRSFREMPTRPTYDVGVHADHHTLWIDPADPSHFYLAGDAGLHESWDMGETYARLNNLPIGQFYGIGADMREPYWIYGGMQDNHSWMGPSATRHWLGVLADDWQQIGFGDGMQHDADPTSHRYIYNTAQNGSLARVDAETGDRLDIEPEAPEGERYRFDWVTPVLVSRHDPHTVYFGGNRLFISRNRGDSWERTEDLTRQIDRDTLELMGVPGAEIALSRNDGTSSFGEITTIAESPLDPAILWVGTDDGNVQVSRDGGRSWTEVSGNVPGIPDGAYVSRIIASVVAPGVTYATFDAHRRGDFGPYVYRTDSFGDRWRPLHDGLPADGSVNVIREHPDNPDLLFVGTEHALFASNDRGESWIRLGAGAADGRRRNLPTTLIDDVLIHPRDNDLVVGTHGRSIWILDDLTPLVDWSPQVAAARVHLFPVRPATIFQYWKDTSYRAQAEWAGENRPFGAILNYYLGRPADSVSISVTNVDGDVVRRLDAPPAEAGVIRRVTWDLRHPPPPSEPDDDEPEALPVPPQPLSPRGPFVSPGAYTVTLEADGVRARRTVVVRGDPLMPLTQDQWRERETFLLEVAELQRRAWDAERRAERMAQTGDGGSPPAAGAGSAQQLERRLGRIRRGLYGLASDFNGRGVRQGTLHPPTATHRERKTRLAQQLEEALAELDEAAQVSAASSGP